MIPYQLGIGMLGFRMHLVTTYVWAFYRLGETADAHSGYEFPWSPFRLLPFSAPASYHNFHHSHNLGNYASFYALWDSLFATNHAYYKFRDS